MIQYVPHAKNLAAKAVRKIGVCAMTGPAQIHDPVRTNFLPGTFFGAIFRMQEEDFHGFEKSPRHWDQRGNRQRYYRKCQIGAIEFFPLPTCSCAYSARRGMSDEGPHYVTI